MAKLTRRKGKNNWEIQYPLPGKLRPVLRTSAIYRSLGTPDKAEAKRQFSLKLAEVHAEVISLLAQHFPDDDNTHQELKGLLDAFKRADSKAEPGEVSERDLLIDAAREWGERQRRRRIKAHRGSPSFHRHKAVAHVIEAKAEEMVLEAIDPRIKIADLVKQWRSDVKPRLALATQEEYERAISAFLAWCQDQRLATFEQIDRRAVREFVADKYHGRLGKTVKLALGALRGVWKHAVTAGWIEEEARVWSDHNYADNVRIGTGEKKADDEHERPFSFDDIRALLKGVKPRVFCDVLCLGLITGARSGELSSLQPGHLTKEDDGFWITIPGTKNKNAVRSVPVPRAFDPFLKRLASKAGGKHLIPLYPDKSWPTERDRNRYINKELNRKRRGVKLPESDRQGVHSTRRTYVELMEGAGVPVDTTKLLVGHSRSDITHGLYSKGAFVDLRAAVEELMYPDDIVALINGGSRKGNGATRKPPRPITSRGRREQRST